MPKKQTKKEKIEASDILKKSGEQVLFQVVTTVLKNGQVNVSGFPASITDALMLVGDINKAIMLHFVKQAVEGTVDNHGCIKQSKIIIPKGVNNQAMSKILKPGDNITDMKGSK